MRKNCKSALTREINNVRQFMAEDNVGEVKERIPNIKTKFSAFQKAHDDFHNELTDENLIDESEKYFEDVQENYIVNLTKVKDWLKGQDEVEEKKKEVKKEADKQNLEKSKLETDRLNNFDVEKFDGNPENFHGFFAVFDEHVHQAAVNPSVKLAKLLRFTTKAAYKAIHPCSIVGGNEGYQQARDILKKRFGSDHLVSERLIRNLRYGKPVRTSEELQEIADELGNCRAILKNMSRLSEIDTQSCIVEIVKRLQPYIRNKWKRLALERRRERDSYPNFEDLVRFVEEQADEAMDPIYGSASNSSEKVVRGSASNFSTSASAASSSMIKYPCKLCQQFHKLFNCDKFREMKPFERFRFVKDNQLCENCLMSNHLVATCRKPSFCSVPGCGKKHTKFIHLPPNQDVNRVKGHVSMNVGTNMGKEIGKHQIHLPLVTVKVNDSVNVTALLDNGSTGSFCSRRLVDKLGVRGYHAKYFLSTMNSVQDCKELEVVDLELASVSDESMTMRLTNVLVVDQIPTKSLQINVDKTMFPHLADVPFHSSNGCVDVLIGQDHSEALVPLQVRKGKSGDPFAVKTLFGWSVNGVLPVDDLVSRSVVSNFISCDLENQVRKLWDVENAGLSQLDLAWSRDDQRVVSLWEREIRIEDGHYVLPIPWKDDIDIPNNRMVALSRLNSLHTTLNRKGIFKSYDSEIKKLLTMGYAECVLQSEASRFEDVWYLPHHAVLSEKKPGKLRVVFDCASKFKGESLNDKCLQGPNFTNKLFDVLLRFRRHKFVIMGDIESMYYQVRVPESDKNFLRFLWYDEKGDVATFRMNCHVFGGVWCASASAFALKQTVLDFAPDDVEVADVIRNAFYVDDCLQSYESAPEAISSMKKVCSTLSKGGFRLTKFVTNEESIHSQIPESERAKEVKDFRYGTETRALGVKWNPETDEMYFDTQLEDKSVTRRMILSLMSTTFDPLGLINPVLVTAKLLFQDVTRLKYDWDEVLPQEIQRKWSEWIGSLSRLRDFKIPRCVKPVSQDDAYLELHHFSDSSERVYGCCSYLRCVTKEGDIHVHLLCSKSKVAPIKPISIPRLELQAAVLATRMDVTLRRELHLDLNESQFWTDSQVVLQYIANETQRFHVFVANRVAEIRSVTQPSQWRHIAGSSNPADLSTREQTPEKLSLSNWFGGPAFLHTFKNDWVMDKPEIGEVKSEDPEVKSFQVDVQDHPIDKLIVHHSRWYNLKRAVAWWLRLKNFLKMKRKDAMKSTLSISEVREAEVCIIKHVQQQVFADEVKKLAVGGTVGRSSSIKDLCPMLDNSGVLRVGGRIEHAELEYSARHPSILPKKHPVSEMIVREKHEVAHLGTEWTLCLVRREFWIVSARKVIKGVKFACVTCRKLYAEPCTQKMADLPVERLISDKPPFSYVGIDCFGPFMVKVGRSEVKRYGCVFTCLSIRAVHIEKLDSLDTDSFLNGLRRFVARRGMPVKVFSDNGTNFVGGFSELSKSLRQLDVKQIEAYGTKCGLEWSFNPPHASHMGGIWERMIRVIRRVLSAVLGNCRLNDEILATVFAEVENIINSRPITKLSDSIDDPSPLTPNHLLLLRNGPILPPCISESMYCRRWKYVQNLANQFWKRWVREYLPELAKRNKWRDPQVNVKVNDLVLIKDENMPRNLWPLGLISRVIEGRDGLVRTVHVKTKSKTLVRPITKIIMLEHCA